MAAAIPLVLTGVSTAVGMAGAMSAGQGQKAAADYSASIKQQQATAAIAESNENARRQNIAAQKQLGGMRAGIGASGIQLEGGSAMDVLGESAQNAALDNLTIKHQGEMKAWALRAGANLDMMKGEQAETAGNFAAAGYLLKGISGVAGGMGGGGGGGGDAMSGAEGGEAMAGEGGGAAAAIA